MAVKQFNDSIAECRVIVSSMDSDAVGKAHKSRYQEQFRILAGNKIFLLEVIASSWKKSMENSFTDGEKIKIAKNDLSR